MYYFILMVAALFAILYYCVMLMWDNYKRSKRWNAQNLGSTSNAADPEHPADPANPYTAPANGNLTTPLSANTNPTNVLDWLDQQQQKGP